MKNEINENKALSQTSVISRLNDRKLLLDFLKFHYKENEFRKESTNEIDVDNFLEQRVVEPCGCDEKINHHSLGYDHFSDKCKNQAKFNIVWKNSSGIHSKNYCSIHKKSNEKFLSGSKFDDIVSINGL